MNSTLAVSSTFTTEHERNIWWAQLDPYIVPWMNRITPRVKQFGSTEDCYDIVSGGIITYFLKNRYASSYTTAQCIKYLTIAVDNAASSYISERMNHCRLRKEKYFDCVDYMSTEYYNDLKDGFSFR